MRRHLAEVAEVAEVPGVRGAQTLGKTTSLADTAALAFFRLG